jgi:hypothetical protein
MLSTTFAEICGDVSYVVHSPETYVLLLVGRFGGHIKMIALNDGTLSRPLRLV